MHFTRRLVEKSVEAAELKEVASKKEMGNNYIDIKAYYKRTSFFKKC